MSSASSQLSKYVVRPLSKNFMIHEWLNIFMDDWFQMHNLLNEQIPDDDEPADHDFDVISQSGCDYEENGKGLQLDVDKIIGSTQEEV